MAPGLLSGAIQFLTFPIFAKHASQILARIVGEPTIANTHVQRKEEKCIFTGYE